MRRQKVCLTTGHDRKGVSDHWSRPQVCIWRVYSLGAAAPGGGRAVVQRPRDRVHLFRGRDQWLDRASSSLLLSSLELSDTKVYEP